MRRPLRTVTAESPAEIASYRGLSYSLWLPPPGQEVRGGVVVLHGAGSCKENHYDYARALITVGLAAIVFDQRGHGDSDGPMDGRALEDVASIARLLRDACATRSPVGSGLPLALRGSSMGGYLAILAAQPVTARAVVAICPASGESLARGLRAGTLRFAADVAALEQLFARNDLGARVSALDAPLLLLHAAGDEQVPVEHSRELASRMRSPGSRLVVVPGGDHRSIQHDAELQAVSVRFIESSLGAVRL